MRKLALIFIFQLNIINLFSQDIKMYHGGIFNPMLLQHGQNKFFYNPAAIGETEDKVLTTALSFNDATDGYTSTATYEIPTASRKHSFAFQVNNYRDGVFGNVLMHRFLGDSLIDISSAIKSYNMLEGSFLYSRTIFVGAEGKFNFGGQLVMKRFNFISNKRDNKFSQTIGSAIYKPDFHIGAQYRWRDFYAGISVKNLFEPRYLQIDYRPRNSVCGGFDITIYDASDHITSFITAGNTFSISEKTKLKTSLLIATDEDNMYASNFDLNNTFEFNKRFRIGFSLQDPSVYNIHMYNRYGGYEFIGKRTFSFTNFAVNTGISADNVDIGFAMAAQNYDAKYWEVSALEAFLKIRL